MPEMLYLNTGVPGAEPGVCSEKEKAHGRKKTKGKGKQKGCKEAQRNHEAVGCDGESSDGEDYRVHILRNGNSRSSKGKSGCPIQAVGSGQQSGSAEADDACDESDAVEYDSEHAKDEASG